MLSDPKKYYRDPLYRNSIALMLSQASLSIFGLLFWVVAARTTQSETVGVATAALSASSLIVYVSRFGLDIGLIRFFPLSNRKRELINTVTILTLFGSLILAGVFLVGLGVFSPPLLLLRQEPLLSQFVANVAITSVLTTQMYIFMALRRSDLFLLQCLVLGLRVPLLFLVAPLGVLGIFISVNVASLFPLFFGVVVLYRRMLPTRIEVHRSVLSEIFAFSLGNYSATLLGQLPSTVLPILIVNIVGATASAYFYISYNIAGIAWIIPSSIAISLFVEGSHDMPIREYSVRSLKFAALIAVPVLILMLALANPLLLIFGRQYSEQSLALLRLLLLSTVFVVPISIYISIKRIQKDIKVINFVYLATTVLVIGLGYAALLVYGLIGVGYAWLFSNAAVSIAVVGLIISREKWLQSR